MCNGTILSYVKVSNVQIFGDVVNVKKGLSLLIKKMFNFKS